MSQSEASTASGPERVAVAPGYNGPTDSGNGGYSSGLFAQLVPGPAAVELRSPVPLGTELDVERDPDAPAARVWRDDVLVASVAGAPALELEVPAAPTLAEARIATRSYRGFGGGTFSSCFVCGVDRTDAYGVFAGSVEGRPLVASPWTPNASAVDGSGAIPDEIVWAVLDCPTYFALYAESEELPLAFLARMQAEVLAAPRAGIEHVVAAWTIGRDGRKLHAGSAVFDAEGETLAFARVMLIEARSGPAAEAGGS